MFGSRHALTIAQVFDFCVTIPRKKSAHELIKAIYVGAPDKSSGKRRQSIHICYDLIGFIPLSELMTQEMA